MKWKLMVFRGSLVVHVFDYPTGDRCKQRATYFRKVSKQYTFKIFDPAGKLWMVANPWPTDKRLRWIRPSPLKGGDKNAG